MVDMGGADLQGGCNRTLAFCPSSVKSFLGILFHLRVQIQRP